MKTGALIAEFNPFHRGHKYLIDKMREECEAVIVIMSGNFVQRGECAIFEKSLRARASVENGADLVLELPSVYALSSAEGFSRGAVDILNASGVVNYLWFGSECGDISKLARYADILNEEPDAFRNALAEGLSSGLSFPSARQAALETQLGKKTLLDMPNNILAVEYIRELKRLSSKIEPVTVMRKGAGYNDTDTQSSFPSASGIRNLIKSGENAEKHILYNYNSKPVFMSDFDIIVASRLKASDESELLRIPDCNEEIASRLKAASHYNTFEEIVSAASCKSYTQSRLRRILCNMITGNLFKALPSPTYIRPIAFNKKGSELLKKMKSTSSLPVAARGAILKNDEIFKLECRCTDVYNLILGKEGGGEFDSSPEIISF